MSDINPYSNEALELIKLKLADYKAMSHTRQLDYIKSLDYSELLMLWSIANDNAERFLATISERDRHIERMEACIKGIDDTVEKKIAEKDAEIERLKVEKDEAYQNGFDGGKIDGVVDNSDWKE